MTDRWKPSKKHQKQYPHFDKPLSLGELADIANDLRELRQTLSSPSFSSKNPGSHSEPKEFRSRRKG